jgi:hypothetical protein
MNPIDSIKASIDPILNIRAMIGAVLHPVYIVQRSWSGTQIGDGSMKEVITEVLPSPGIKNYDHNLRVTEGGNIKQGDLLMKMISKNRYPLETDVDCSSSNPVMEKLYKVGDFYYRVVSIVENQVTWDVQVRRLSDQTRRI